jgi:hypothetical protein
MVTIMPPAEQRRADLEEVPSPEGIYLRCVGRADPMVAFAGDIGYPNVCRTAMADLSTWPPRFTFIGEYAVSAARSRQGRWVTASMTSDRPYMYRVRASDRPESEKTLLLPPEERENGVQWAGFIGEQVIAVLSPSVVYPEQTLLPAYPMLEQDGRLVQVGDLKPSAQRFPTFGAVHLNDGRDIFVWDGEGDELRDGCFTQTFELQAKWSPSDDSPMTPFGPNGFFYLANRKLHTVRRGEPPVPHLPKLGNVMNVSAGPPGAVLLKEGHNALGDLGKLYFPDEGVFLRIEPELFEDEDPTEIHSLHWAASSGRLIAATPNRLWAVSAETVLGLPRYRASDGTELRHAR